MANLKIEEIEGIGPVLGEKFTSAGVPDTDTLLDKGCTKSGRKEIADATGISESRVLTFVNMADLFRINGVAGEYAELLVCSSVDTVKELKMRNAAKLAEKLAEVNGKKKLTRKVPSETTLEGWIKQAGELPPMIEH